MSCRAVDVVLPPASGMEWEELLDSLVAELAVPPLEPIVVLRASRRLAAGTAGRPRLVAVTRPVAARGERSPLPSPDPALNSVDPEPGEVHSRPDLATPYLAPRTETESALAGDLGGSAGSRAGRHP